MRFITDRIQQTKLKNVKNYGAQSAPNHVCDSSGVINWQNGENCKLRRLISTVLLGARKRVERMATLTKVEKAASGVKEGSEEKDDECNEKRETRNQNTSRREKSSGRWHDLLSTICRRVSSLLSFPSLSFSLPPC